MKRKLSEEEKAAMKGELFKKVEDGFERMFGKPSRLTTPVASGENPGIMRAPNYRRTAHTVYDAKYHLVWTTKYCYRVLSAKIARRTRDLMREIGQQ